MLKKVIRKPLALTRENIRLLDTAQLAEAAGAGTASCPATTICSGRYTACCPW